jgi:hypothetical protein
MSTPAVDNTRIADALERCAQLLEAQHADTHRVRAYRTAARSVRGWPDSVADLARLGGRDALDSLHGVGKSIAAAIEQLVRTGRWPMLDRLQGEVSTEQLLLSVPGIGPTLAKRVHVQLAVETLEDLELAAHDGRLERVTGFGPRRAQIVRQVLASMLSHKPMGAGPGEHAPSVAALLKIDAQYRSSAAQGVLQRIAPRRFNPRGLAWLPILHAEIEGFHVHALFSNTALAHKLGRTSDWVVIYYDRDGYTGQQTVVTEQHGPLAGRRVVRGHEAETADCYANTPPQPSGEVSLAPSRAADAAVRRAFSADSARVPLANPRAPRGAQQGALVRG